jgi:3-deoxy-D-arabino-heptulosonate 7-phosphate (DAHP) synthase class II
MDAYIATLDKIDALVDRIDPKHNPNRNEMIIRQVSRLVDDLLYILVHGDNKCISSS